MRAVELLSLLRAVKMMRAARIMAPFGMLTALKRTPFVWLGFMSIWLAVMMAPSLERSSALLAWLVTWRATSVLPTAAVEVIKSSC